LQQGRKQLRFNRHFSIKITHFSKEKCGIFDATYANGKRYHIEDARKQGG
jgi:hypothetical protein